MAQIKMVFSDVDGTLLDSNDQITPTLKQTIEQVTNKGIKVILTSARPPFGADFLQKDLEIETDPLISFNGALISKENRPTEILKSLPLDKTIAQQVIKLVHQQVSLDLQVNVYTYQTWYVEMINQWTQEESKTIHATPKVVNVAQTVDQLTEPIYKLLIGGNAHNLLKFEAILKDNLGGQITYVRSKPTHLEIISKLASKGEALKATAQANNIHLENVFAIGDGYNDVPMLEVAGTGVAMGQAPNLVKESANFVTTDNDHDGVANALKKYVLQENV